MFVGAIVTDPHCKVPTNMLQGNSNAVCNTTPQQRRWSMPPYAWLVQASHYKLPWGLQAFVWHHHDIHSKPWADPVIQMTMKQIMCIKFVKEEINDCNIEIQHLFTHILDEDTNICANLQRLQQEGSSITSAVEEYAICRHWANAFNLSHIFNTLTWWVIVEVNLLR